MRTILIIAHEYPPIYSAGAERIRNFARYLPEFGYRPLILTTGHYGGLTSDAMENVYRAADLSYRPGDLSHSEQAATKTLALPIYPELTEEIQAAVIEAIAKAYIVR